MGSVWVCARVPVQGRCGSVGDPYAESVSVSGRSLSGVSVGLWEGPVQDQCGCVGGFCLGTLWVCQGSLSGVSVDLSRSFCGFFGGPVLDQCGYVGGPSLGSVWICLGLCVGFLGALCWISVGIWLVPIWGQCGSDPLFEGDPPLLCFLHLTAGEGQGPLHVWFLAVLSVSLLCYCSRQAP